jgi:hypothetical protein
MPSFTKSDCVAAGSCRDGLLQQLLHHMQRSWVLRVLQAAALLASSRRLLANPNGSSTSSRSSNL